MRSASIAVSAVALALPALAGGGTPAQPSLRLTKLSPPSVHGSHFRVGEKVGVTLRSGTTRVVRTVRVSRRGQFTVVFGGITELDRCGLTAPSLVAVGSRGERVVVKLPRPPAGCPAAPATGSTTPSAGGDYLAPPPPYTK